MDVSGASASTMFIWEQLIAQGDRDRAKTVSDMIIERAERTQDPDLLMNSALIKANAATLDGRLEESIEIAESIATVGAEHGRDLASGGMAAALQKVLLGRAREVLEDSELGPRDPVRAWLLAEVGLEAEAPTQLLYVLLGAAISVNDHPSVKLAAGKLGVLAHLSTFPGTVMCPALMLGGAAVLLRQPGEARELFRQALKLSEGIRNRPVIAHTRLELAELLLDHYPDERAEALEHLDFATTELRDMKMQPALERALSSLERQKDKKPSGPSYPKGLPVQTGDMGNSCSGRWVTHFTRHRT